MMDIKLIVLVLYNTLDGIAFRDEMISIMTTNYECNLDAALKDQVELINVLTLHLRLKNKLDLCIKISFLNIKKHLMIFIKL